MIEALISPEVVEQHGITPQEYLRIVAILGRDPNLTELGIFSVMWSEHCSYKSSRVHLKRLPTAGACVLQGPGENAGVVDLGDGYAIAFKIESHNHPSLVEPFQGAATGVGGILRDIFTMGARPIAAMNSLRFGRIKSSESMESPPQGRAGSSTPDNEESELRQNRRILSGVVGGIGFYGNCFGVPTVGGEIYFEDCYAKNPLVNAFALGLFERDSRSGKPRIFLGRASGPGNAVIYVGAKTGRDGIHGASLLASSEFDETTASKRPNVQVGDPFLEKCLLEACLETMEADAIVGIQDMGAAGLTCSTSEMAARGDTGIEIELNHVPQRETGMSPYEIMLSESQERMLLVAERGRMPDIQGIFSKWGLDAVEIGRVTKDGILRVRDHGEVVAEIPAKALADEAPLYNRPMKARKPLALLEKSSPRLKNLESVQPGDAFMRLLSSENLCSRRWVYQQYDHMVRTNTCILPGADAAVIRIKNTNRAIAITLDGNGRYCYVNPREGARLAVAEACRNLVCVGAQPLAATNCLNFGNPEKPEIMWAFSEVIDGMKEACEAFHTPITGGNVSFYNETFGKGIYGTPVMGMVGVIDDLAHLTSPGFKREGDVIAALGDLTPPTEREFLNQGTEFARVLLNASGAQVPALILEREKRLQDTILTLIHQGTLHSCHDVSEGGLAIALAECAFASGPPFLGCEIEIQFGIEGLSAWWFNENPSRAVISFEVGQQSRIEAICRRQEIPFQILGRVRKHDFKLKHLNNWIIQQPVDKLFGLWDQELERLSTL
ncbi:MAG: phosphoribosylformylglycinamidine synthase subunit PurL [Acidobacteriia bacterium]|nr:phosphoribosylformylglycinamidine synthase subunit PurL [Terriglobia bacterium]